MNKEKVNSLFFDIYFTIYQKINQKIEVAIKSNII